MDQQMQPEVRQDWQPEQRRGDGRRVALVLQGGGALGA